MCTAAQPTRTQNLTWRCFQHKTWAAIQGCQCGDQHLLDGQVCRQILQLLRQACTAQAAPQWGSRDAGSTIGRRAGSHPILLALALIDVLGLSQTRPCRGQHSQTSDLLADRSLRQHVGCLQINLPAHVQGPVCQCWPHMTCDMGEAAAGSGTSESAMTDCSQSVELRRSKWLD